jgi:hypothetical protein
MQLCVAVLLHPHYELSVHKQAVLQFHTQKFFGSVPYPDTAFADLCSS